VAHPGYFDAAAATPLHPAAREALAAALTDGWADPEKLYTQARRARQLLDAARAATAEVIGVRTDEVFFCASGTAACHLAVLGTLRARRRAGATFIHSSVEHSAVLRAAGAHVESIVRVGSTWVSSPRRWPPRASPRPR
jgi:cysteine desulfurase